MGYVSPWTDAIDETARVNWTAGVSASNCVSLIYQQHGIMLGRNAVIGRAHRQGWKTPTKPMERSGAVAVRKARSSRNYKELAQRPKLPKDTRPRIPDTTESRNMTLLELGPTDCRYPTTPDDVTSHLFCGAEQEPGSPYCAHHTMLCGRSAGGGAPRPRRFVLKAADLPHGKTYSEHSGSSA